MVPTAVFVATPNPCLYNSIFLGAVLFLCGSALVRLHSLLRSQRHTMLVPEGN